MTEKSIGALVDEIASYDNLWNQVGELEVSDEILAEYLQIEHPVKEVSKRINDGLIEGSEKFLSYDIVSGNEVILCIWDNRECFEQFDGDYLDADDHANIVQYTGVPSNMAKALRQLLGM